MKFFKYLFHRFSLHAIEANLVAVPLTSLVIMPAALFTCLLTPLGLGEGPLWVFEQSLEMLMLIASTTAGWPGANVSVAHPSFIAFTSVVIGGLWLSIWQQRWRKWSLIPTGVGAIMIFWQNPPHLLVDGQGKIAALYQGNTLHVSSSRKGKFTAENWKNYVAAGVIETMPCEEGVSRTFCNNIPLIISASKENQPCEKGAILIRLDASQRHCPEALLTIDWFDLWRGGGHALWVHPKGLRVEKVRASQGNRPWTCRSVRRKDRPGF